MNINAIDSVKADLVGLAVFSQVREQPLMKAFSRMIEAISGDDTVDMVSSWASFVEVFAEVLEGFKKIEKFEKLDLGSTWFEAVIVLVLLDDNTFTRSAELSPLLLATLAKTDLARLSRIASFDVCAFAFYMADKVRKNGPNDAVSQIEEEARGLWAEEGKHGNVVSVALDVFPKKGEWQAASFAKYVHKNGAGILGFYSAFCFEESLVPVQNPDRVRLSDFSGYEEQRTTVINNTLRFLEGKSANNILLYGDRGTGKSATIKALCNEFAVRGLRLVEVRKNNLRQLPHIMKSLANRGLRFINFVDDLSFETTDDSFTALKGLLEGGLETKPPNVVIYATSNRRHLVKERFSDRPDAGDGPRSFDTMQEQFSLSDRFGLTVVFTSPDQDEFLRIAKHIATQRGILALADDQKKQQFCENALKWERWFNGRSPRTAVQYVDWVCGGEGFPWE
jgi:predicted AAA+ superfamily ATPase